jgi:hypothetical protein
MSKTFSTKKERRNKHIYGQNGFRMEEKFLREKLKRHKLTVSAKHKKKCLYKHKGVTFFIAFYTFVKIFKVQV